jgi:hypothetical protein
MLNKIITKNNDPEWVIVERDKMAIFSHHNKFCCEYIDPKIIIEKFNARFEDGHIYVFTTEDDAKQALEYIEPFLIMEELMK